MKLFEDNKGSKILVICLLCIILVVAFISLIFYEKQKRTQQKENNNIANSEIKKSNPNNPNPEIIIDLINKIRQENNLSQVTVNTKLTQAAQAKVDDMFSKQYYEIYSPDDKTPSDFLDDVKYEYISNGLLLGEGYANEKEIVDTWMSSGYQNSILNSKYFEIGVAVSFGKLNGSDTWLTVLFIAEPNPCDKPDKTSIQNITKENYKDNYQENLNLVNQYNEKVKAYNECLKQNPAP